jgi:enoyl-CoA hydratase/carnithine racemase
VELGDLRDADRYLKMGVRHFCVGWDIDIIHKYCRDQGATFARFFGKERGRKMNRIGRKKPPQGYAAAQKGKK